MNREDWGNLAAFAAVAEARSFTKAATRLGLSPSALSHSIRGLEERLGARLLARSTRSVATTEAGERLLARLRPALDDIVGAVEDLGRLLGKPAGRIRITSTRQAARLVISPKLPQFHAEYPDVQVELLIEQGFTDIIGQRFDAGVRLGEALAKDMVSVRISGNQQPVVVGSPKYLGDRVTPKHPRELRQHSCIGFRLATAGVVYRWEFAKRGQKLEVAPEGPVIFNDEDMMVDAAVAGIGLAYVFEDQVRGELGDGRLVKVLESWCEPIAGFFLYYPSRKHTPAALTALVGALRVPDARRPPPRRAPPP
jgi:DNA-binding transcriptional LysR family regulator